MWEAVTPEQYDEGTSAEHWRAAVREHTMQFACHMTLRGGAWSAGRHRNAATAFGCAEAEAKRRNKAAA